MGAAWEWHAMCESALNRSQNFWYRDRNYQLPVHQVFSELSNAVIVELSKVWLGDLHFVRKFQDLCLIFPRASGPCSSVGLATD